MKSIYSILFIIFLAGCDGAPTKNICADFDCSGHGTCVVVRDASNIAAPTCRCDTGYTPAPSGWVCLPKTATPALCDGVKCSGFGTCVSAAGAARCVCNSGYTLGADGKTCNDPCASISCGSYGSCTRTAKGPICQCNSGYRVTADGKGCEATLPAGLTTYQFTYDDYATYQAGKLTLDTAKQTSGQIVERTKLSLGFDYYRRGLYRDTWQSMTLDSTGKQITAMEYDETRTQGKISRRRWGKVTFGSGKISVTQQRLDKTYTYSISYSGSLAPLPMLGGQEFPGWSLGCFSPTFYRLLFMRYGSDKVGTKTIQVFMPSSGTVESLTVTSHANWVAGKPVLGLPKHKVQVTYDSKGWPSKIWFESQEMSWKPYSGTPFDLNLGPRKAATAVTAATLPKTFKESKATIKASDGNSLYGVLSVPSGVTSGAPAVLLVSGLFGKDRDHPYLGLGRVPLYKHLAAHLAGAGYVVLRYDPRGRANSGGKASTATLTRLTADAAAALTTLSGEKTVNTKKIFVLSHGYGALIAAPLLKGKTAVAGYIGIAPVLAKVDKALFFGQTDHVKAAGFSTNYMARTQRDYDEDVREIKAGTHSETTFGDTPVAQIKELLSASVASQVSGYAGPVLLLRGDQDMVVPADQLTDAAAAAKAAGKTNLTSSTLKGRTFVLSEGKRSDLWESAFLPLSLPSDAVKAVTDWLAKQ